MNKIDWARKLTSRKFWAAVVGFVTPIMIAAGSSESEITRERDHAGHSHNHGRSNADRVHNRRGADRCGSRRNRPGGREAGGYQIAGGDPKSNNVTKNGGEAEVLSLLC